MKPIRLLLVDDHFFVRSGLAASLSSESDLHIAGEAEDVPSAIAAWHSLRPDVTLLDLRLGSAHGLEVLRAIHAQDSAAAVLIFSVEETEEEIYRAHAAGARGYLPKSAPRRALLDALRTLAAGGRSFPPAAEALIRERHTRTGLSPRELEVLRLIAEGLPNKLIADRLGIAENTVKVHIARLLEKLDAPDRTTATRVALQRGLFRL